MTTAAKSSEKLADERKDYYDKWEKFTSEEVKKVKFDEVSEVEQATKALGLDKAPRSEAEKQDKEKFVALKEAKKQWEEKKLGEASMKFDVENLSDCEKVLDSVKLHWKPVITIKNNKNAKLKIPKTLKHKLIKVFIENCEGCEIHIDVPLVTQHIEVSHCSSCKIFVGEHLATLQLDLCNKVEVFYAEGLMIPEKTQIYHAGVEKLKVATGDGHDHSTCYTETVQEDDKLPKEVQFLTHLVDNELRTERVFRDRGNLPATKGQLDEQMLDEKDMVRQAELKKIGGNEAFKEKNYAQAGVFYTEAIDILEQCVAEGRQGADGFLHVCYCNRAFTWQKLGHHEKAEADSRRALEISPDYCKAMFRLGLALHAQKKYFEAVPLLGKALKLEPKNDQIKQALQFAEVQLKKAMQQHEY